jgi:hypothetical protein
MNRSDSDAKLQLAAAGIRAHSKGVIRLIAQGTDLSKHFINDGKTRDSSLSKLNTRCREIAQPCIMS